MQITGQKKKKKAPAKPSVSALGAMGQAPGMQSETKMSFVGTAGTAEVIRPGIVVLRQVVPMDLQQDMLDTCFSVGRGPEGSAGFFEVPEGAGPSMLNTKLKLNQGNRGRLIHPIGDFPRYFDDSCRNWVKQARSSDPAMPDMSPTTALVNFYNQKGTFKWHRDSEDPALLKNDRGPPIVSVTIGEACDFGMKYEYDADDHMTVRLNSGDVLLFGGPSRMVVHSVLRIIPNTRPPLLRFPYQAGRLNITFREVTGVIDTSMFPSYRVSYDIEEG
ncbi:Alpha-ketoglutarate-dependent dioxygenase abh1 [Diplonema papillatum]|nr:Alpha-ketoglutarate-dependent dioxygenase abh1 [Diplonema papillatum]KAJ9444146.1 Alpha-ketoglutarate-dependent dioxygenase abh1 [Diplonema papillatum]